MTELIVQVATALVVTGSVVGSMRQALRSLEKRLDRIEALLDTGLQRIAALEATRRP